jgi:hypothetical protein
MSHEGELFLCRKKLTVCWSQDLHTPSANIIPATEAHVKARYLLPVSKCTAANGRFLVKTSITMCTTQKMIVTTSEATEIETSAIQRLTDVQKLLVRSDRGQHLRCIAVAKHAIPALVAYSTVSAT